MTVAGEHGAKAPGSEVPGQLLATVLSEVRAGRNAPSVAAAPTARAPSGAGDGGAFDTDEAPSVFPRRWFRVAVAWWLVTALSSSVAVGLVPGSFPYMAKVVLVAGLYTIPGLGVSRLLVRRSYPSERAQWWPWLYGLRCFFVWGYGIAIVYIDRWLPRYPAGSEPWRTATLVSVVFGAAGLVLWGAVIADTVRHGLGGRDRSEVAVDAVLVAVVLSGPVMLLAHVGHPSVVHLMPAIARVIEPIDSLFGLAAMVFWGMWLLQLLRRTAGLRAVSVDFIDLGAVVVATAAIPLAAVLPAVLAHRSVLWLTLPLLAMGAVLPGLLCAAVILVARRPEADARGRRGARWRPRWDEAWTVVLLVLDTANAWTQLAMVLSGFRLPAGLMIAPLGAAFGLFLVRPLAERRRPLVGLDARAPEDQVRRWDLAPAVVALAAVALVVQLAVGGASVDGERVIAVVLGFLVVLAAARHRASVGETRRMHGRIRSIADELYRQARLDPLTGLANRRALAERFDRMAASCARASRPLVVAMVDLDHFKAYNDTHGHLAGDGVLRDTAERLRGAVRQEDMVARFGGEEFCLVLPGAEPDQAAAMLDRLRERTGMPSAGLDAPGPGWAPQRTGGPVVGFSAGVARWRPGERFEEVVLRADAACYAAKALGRGRVVVDGTARSAC